MNATLLALAVLVPLARPIASQDDASADGNKLVALELLADHQPIQPGSTFTLALRCRIERRWHVYWGENAGDAGVPFQAVITGPVGYEIGKVRFPWPRRHEIEGDIVEYIQEGEMTLLADVKVPARAKSGEVAHFDVQASWLVCTDVCVRGNGATGLDVPVADKSAVANETLFTAARAKLPRPWSEIGRALANVSGAVATPRLNVVVPGATALEFFPYTSTTTQLMERKAEVGKQGASLVLDFAFKPKQEADRPQIRGVLWVKTDQGETSFLLEKTHTP